MRLVTITNWAYGATVLLTLASGVTTLLASNAQEQERAAVAQRYQLDQTTSETAADVTALSDHARAYVITGEAAQRDEYRGEVNALTAVEDRVRRIKDIGAGTDELNAIAEAMRLADQLRDEQEDAVAAREKGDADRARSILFGAEYERQLDRIAAQVERFQYRLNQRTEAEVAVAVNVARIWKTTSEIVLGVTGLLFLWVLYFVFKRRVLHRVLRLSDVVSRLASQDYAVEAPTYGEIDEIGDMAQAIRVFRENGIERLRLEEERSADIAMRALLSRMTQRMQGCETMHHFTRVIESFVPEVAPGYAGRLYLFDEDRGTLVETCSWQGPVHSRPEFSPSSCWALQRGHLHRPRGKTVDVPCDHLDATDEAAIDSICLPLIAQRATLGLLYLEPMMGLSEPPAEVAEAYLEVLAENIGLAAGNLRLRDTLRAMAMADPLTGLPNRRHLEAVLEYRVAEAERSGQPMSCVMVDVDYFKRFNDTFGHAAGDAVLRAVGGLLNQSIRETNLAFRYGGEEFLLVLPNLDATLAAQRAEEIRSKIHGLRVEHGGRELGPITASFGVATAPEHCAFGHLVQAADAALLRAKAAGRDRVVVAAARRTASETLGSPTRAIEG